MSYTITLDAFEGPLDLLLRLIQDRELDITRVSLAQVTDQYLEYIESDTSVTLEQLSDFLVVAARLLLIKSKALLPALELTPEEDEEIDDLEWRLLEYKHIKEVCEKWRELLADDREMFSREFFLGLNEYFQQDIPEPIITSQDIHVAFLHLVESIPDPQKLKEHILKRVASLEERIAQLHKYIVQRANFSFADITGKQEDKMEVVISFLAILELMKSRVVSAHQENLFGDIQFYAE